MLVEREPQLRTVADHLDAAARGRGAAVAVSGPAGIGKTALLDAARAAGQSAGFRVLRAAGGEWEQELPFAVVRQLLEPAVEAAPAAARDELFAGAAGLARSVFASESSPAGVTSSGIGHGLYWLCANLAESAPLLLVVDDVHWADEASLRFLVHLARRTDDLPLLLILAARPVAPEHPLAGTLARLPAVPMPPLSSAAVASLVRSTLGDADEEFVRACAQATGGNPFLLTEALRALRAEQVAPVAGQVHRVEQIRPQAVSASVLGRLARMGQDATTLCRAVAVLGPAAQPRHVAALAQLPLRRVAELVDELATAGILTAGRPISFVHPLVRHAVYTDEGELLRATDHKRAAHLLHADAAAADSIVGHLIAAEPESDPWLVQRLREAATLALARGATEVAVACLQRAVAEPPVPEQRAEVLAELGRYLGMANQPEQAAEAFRAAYELTEKDADRVDIAFQLGTLMIHTGRGSEANTAFDLARAAADGNAVVLESRLLSAFLMAMATMEPAPRRPDRAGPDRVRSGPRRRSPPRQPARVPLSGHPAFPHRPVRGLVAGGRGGRQDGARPLR